MLFRSPNISNRSKFKKYKLTFFKNISDVSFKKLNINVILIAVKPQIVEEVLGNLKVILNRKVLLISIVAGKNIGAEEWISETRNVWHIIDRATDQQRKGWLENFYKYKEVYDTFPVAPLVTEP